jgi:ferredoxin
MPKLIHYRAKCIGCGICHDLQPDLWRMSKKDGLATLVNGELKKDTYQLEINEQIAKQSKYAVESCPVGIIKVMK